MTEIAVRQNTGGTLTEKIEWSRAMAPGNLLPPQYRGNPANLLFAVEYADALGIERVNALTSIHVIEGKPSASADLIAGLVRRAGHRLRITGNDVAARAVLIRADDPEFEYVAEWDLARARTAGLANKGVWKSYPAAMLRSRAITEVARMGASDVLLGVSYTPEELGAEVNADGLPTRPQAIPAPPVTAAEIIDTPDPGEEIHDAEVVEDAPPAPITRDQLAALGRALRDAGLDDKDDALATVADIVGHPVANTRNLTADEAQTVVDTLTARTAAAAKTEPPAVDVDPEDPWAVGGAA